MAKSEGHLHRPAISLDPGSFRPPSGYTPGTGHHDHQKSFTTTREAYHRGRRIKIRTTYRIEIDGEPLTLHTTVLDDGTVHCHGLPNYSFPSAVDMAKSIIDAARLAHYDTDELGPSDGDGHDGHEHHAGQHGAHGGDHR